MRKIFSAIFLIILMMTSYLNAQIEWIKYESNPILTPGGVGQSVFIGHSSVIYHDGLYEMWYDGADNSSGIGFQIFYAYSHDGINWTKHDTGAVLSMGSTGEWDSKNAFGSEVMFMDSVYKMWYVSRDGSPFNGQMGYAESVDGINWQKSEQNPIMTFGSPG